MQESGTEEAGWGVGEMPQRVRALEVLAENQVQFLTPYQAGVREPTPLSGLCGHLSEPSAKTGKQAHINK